ncbi:LOB domain-containing protein 19 [Morus notabilis]|uniref:LOB domain-containing protein 19 n=1 Tax=Morus notabilis TaxID=981085 RepID=UPI000CED1284|nr:LOB domain-containing protein 19 [Morus notabilis]
MMNANNNGSSSYNTNTSTSGPCGACKFLRRKCVKGCIFAPYFDADQGTAHFAAVHKVFGASNASKLLLRIPPHKRLDAVVSLSYEALARIRDPVYGCVAHIFALQQQVVNLQAELAYVQARLSTLQRPPEALIQPQSTSPTSMHSLTDVVASTNSDIALTSNILMHLDPLQPQASSELASFSPFDLELHDGELQVLGRQFVSRYLPAALRFRSSSSY